jgi:hypothetical protein
LQVRLDDYLSGGLSRWGIGENVAWGSGRYGTPEAIVDAWMNRRRHLHDRLRPARRLIRPQPGARIG